MQWTSKTPTASAVVPNDPDGNTVRAEFRVFTSAGSGTNPVSSCDTAMVAGGTSVTCVMPAIPDNATYWLRYRTWDGYGYSAWSPAREFTVAGSVPNTPSISCPAPYGNGSWTDTVPSSKVRCTITVTGSTTSAPLWAAGTLDGVGFEAAVTQPTSSASFSFPLDVANVSGQHSISVYAISPIGTASATRTHTFGLGQLAFATPAENAVTTDTVALRAQGPASATGSSVQWRVGGALDATSGWASPPASATSSLTFSLPAGTVSGLFDTTALVGVADASGAKVSARTASTVEVKVCFTYVSGTKCATRSIVRVPHAYGAGFPTTDAGPASIALWTGEVQVSDTDAEFNTPGAGLSVSRTFSSLAGPAEPRNAIFGPGWAASLDAAESAGLSGSEVYDSTRVDGTIVVESAEGDVLVFAAPSGKRRTTATLEAGTWKPVTDDTTASGLALTITTSSGTVFVTITDDDGVVTTFTGAAPAAGTDATFAAFTVADAVTGESTSYRYDNLGRVTAMVAPLPEGIGSCDTAAPQAGCRFLSFTYSATDYSSVTPDAPWRLTGVSATNGTTTKQVASYTYTGATGQLWKATDTLTGLTTTYTYTTPGKIATITPPGEKPYTIEYQATAPALVSGVTRTQPAPLTGTMQLARILPITDLSTVTGLNMVQFGPGSGYDLPRVATRGFAVFGPDRVKPAGAAIAADDWPYASLYLTDDDGYTIHTGSMGAGEWQLDATVYDDHDNVIKTWDARTVAAIRANQADPERNLLDGPVAQLASDTTYTADGAHVVASVSPIRRAVIPGGDPEGMSTRVKTVTLYDEGTPTPAEPAWLVTRILTTVIDGDGTEVYKLGATINGYAKVDPADVKTGWELRQPTTVTTDMNGDQQANTGDITRTTRYDARGRTIEDRQPLSSGTDAGTRQTLYYTGTGTGGCVNATYAGLVCQVGPKAQPSGVTVPVTKTTGYTWAMQPTTTVTTSGTVTQTTTTGYDTAFRPTTSQTVTTGLASSTPVPATTTTYDPAGRVASESNQWGTINHSYDEWGRETRYETTSGGQTDYSNTTYDALGQVATVVTNQTTTVYTYDGTDALGQTERRGLTTKVTVTTSGKTWTSTGAYDAQGTLTLEKLPGGIIKRSTYDTAGELVDHTWNGPATQADGTITPDQPWLAWSSRSDPAGRVVHEWMPDGQLATSGDLGAAVAASDRSYSYDPAGRLTQVRDLTGDPTITAATPCTLRTYGFDRNGNRTSQGTATSANNTRPTTVTSSVSPAYDTADRPTTGANGTGTYTYDPLGRQTSIPAVDTPQGATAGNTGLAYYDTDAIQSITQAGTTIGFTLDAGLRRSTQTTTTGGVSSTLMRHYTDSSDNPTWSVDTTSGQTTTTRYAELIAGDLGLTITTTNTGTTATIAVSGPRGDVTSQITLPADATTPTTGTPAGLDWWNDYTEHGQPTTPQTVTPGSTTGIGYGWLGAKQRATTLHGYTLMGARLHNPTTGLFTSLDPIHGGNETTYGYPNDPINHVDLDGQWCVGRVGNSCPRVWKNGSGERIHVSNATLGKLQAKHGISQSTARYLLERLGPDRGVVRGANRKSFGGRLYEMQCRGWLIKRCVPTGQSIYVTIIVDYSSGRPKKTDGTLVTMFCLTNRGHKCPSWVNSPKLR
ncbi:hypothetical protein ACSDQ9_08310 [Aestuariimicrobium soli]|uniref:hypothetical protein n=1 Tax=Aestuariimicrobium soli TaxID=2035834 RepID=UPI003EBADD68